MSNNTGNNTGYRYGLERLEKIKTFLLEYGAADLTTLQKLFFPSRHRAQVVLTSWVKAKELSRKRYDEYLYFLPGCKGNIRQGRRKAAFYASSKDFPSWWTIKKVNESYKCIKLGKEGVLINPLFSPADLVKPKEANVTVGWEKEGFPKVETLKEAVKLWIPI
jgi:hypothetical protein